MPVETGNRLKPSQHNLDSLALRFEMRSIHSAEGQREQGVAEDAGLQRITEEIPQMLPDHVGVNLECAISHPRHTVMFTNLREAICKQDASNFGITRDLQKTFCQTINIIRLNQQAAASSLYDFSKPAASRLNYGTPQAIASSKNIPFGSLYVAGTESTSRVCKNEIFCWRSSTPR